MSTEAGALEPGAASTFAATGQGTYFTASIAHPFIIGSALFAIFWGVVNALLVSPSCRVHNLRWSRLLQPSIILTIFTYPVGERYRYQWRRSHQSRRGRSCRERRRTWGRLHRWENPRGVEVRRNTDHQCKYQPRGTPNARLRVWWLARQSTVAAFGLCPGSQHWN